MEPDAHGGEEHDLLDDQRVREDALVHELGVLLRERLELRSEHPLVLGRDGSRG